MKKRMVGMMLATSMVFLLLTGCGGSGNTSAATTAEAVQTTEADKTESAEEKDVSEEKAIETQEGVAEEAVAESTDTTVEAKKYRVKTLKTYSITEDGEKTLIDQTECEYDEKGNNVSQKTTDANGSIYEAKIDYDEYGNEVYRKNIFDGRVNEFYYENELDEEGRILKRFVADGEKNPLGSTDEYSYIDDRYKWTSSLDGFVTYTEEGFVSDGKKYPTTIVQYTDDYPKAEDGESYFQKIVYEYEGTIAVGTKYYNMDHSLTREEHSEVEEVDENNNPLIVHTYVKYDEITEEYIYEATYMEIE